MTRVAATLLPLALGFGAIYLALTDAISPVTAIVLMLVMAIAIPFATILSTPIPRPPRGAKART